MNNTKLSPWPSFTQEEADKISQVLLSNRVNYWTGEEGKRFEREFADYIGVPHAIAVANGTVALELALRALKVGVGDEVIVTPRTFIASISCIIAVGATPVFADVDLSSQNITAETIARVVTDKTKGIICVHLSGWPCDMDDIMTLAEERSIKVIEDCAQAHGAKYKGRVVGSIGDVGTFSFCQDKIITTGGEGGLLTIKDESVWKAAWAYKDHGKSWDAVHDDESSEGFLWLHESFGSNYRLTEMQSAIGRIQLKKLDTWVRQRNKHAHIIAHCCQKYAALRVPLPSDEYLHAYYKMYVFVDPEYLSSGWTRDKIISEIGQSGGICFQGACPEVYLEKAFDGTSLRPDNRLPNVKMLGETSLMFPVHPTLSEQDIDIMCQAIERVMQQASINND